jgi:hypothetical protein
MKHTIVFDAANNRIVTEDDSIQILYTDELTCPNRVIEEVVRIMNETTQDYPLGSEGEIDAYLLDEPDCDQDDREIIVEGLYPFYVDNLIFKTV